MKNIEIIPKGPKNTGNVPRKKTAKTLLKKKKNYGAWNVQHLSIKKKKKNVQLSIKELRLKTPNTIILSSKVRGKIVSTHGSISPLLQKYTSSPKYPT